MDLSEKFQETHPHAFFLDEDDIPALQEYLRYQGWLDEDKNIQSVGKAGEGNMNKVLRVNIDGGSSFIIKQSRPWVEKFPDIPAPADRANIEGLYIQQTSQNETIDSHSPALLHSDPDSHILIMEDLGDGSDLTYLYEKGTEMDEDTLQMLMDYLSALHQNFTRPTCDFYIENFGMRRLNAEHIFRFPFIEDNGLDLDEITAGLADLAARYRKDSDLLAQIDFLKSRYLQNGHVLLQGDYYPGSFLQTEEGVHVIDPEFCFFGDAEFDLGVFYAHLLMANQPDAISENILDKYETPMGFSDLLFRQYAGVEIMRRILGLAQLPLPLDLEGKKDLLERAYSLVMDE
ncbi:MAG TPA: phosphotransferase [Balneolaceae bacterium]|nr:phosphotransferase [Balneolaceae bacterium]